jgi:transposase
LVTPFPFSSITHNIKISPPQANSSSIFSQMAKDTVDEAIDSLKSGQFTSRRAAARHFDVNPDTVSNWMKGILSRQEAHAYRQNLSPEEEQLLLSWIQAEDLAGTSPTYARIHAMANTMY